jgi:polygalacturonase
MINDGLYSIFDYGAVPDGTTACTVAVQSAIDACEAGGGGEVIVPPGRFAIGTIHLKSNVFIRLFAGGLLIGSTSIEDYAADTGKNMYDGEPHMDRCLIFAEGQHDFGIIGNGTIDGRGDASDFPNPDDPAHNRPMMIRFIDCERITVRDVSLIDPADWTSAWLYCRDVVVDGITIHSRVNGNGDGLDFDGCENVRVANCAFDNSDDSICLQASRKDRPCRRVTVTNCIFSTKWGGMRIGLLSLGDFEQVTVSNCVFHDIEDAGLKIQMCEGGSMKNMTFSNLVMHNVPRPVFMTFNRQKAGVDSPDPVPEMSELRNIVFDTITIDCDPGFPQASDSAFLFTGVPGGRIENITLNNVNFTGGGGGTAEEGDREDVGEMDNDPQPPGLPRWPEYAKIRGRVPAACLYARHIKGIRIQNSMFSTRLADRRPAFRFDDAEDIDIVSTSVDTRTEDARLLFRECREGRIDGCRAKGGELHIETVASSGIEEN